MDNRNQIAESMASAAEMDLALPYSLVMDAWDSLMHPATRHLFGLALKEAIARYEAEPENYQFNDKAL
jgi:hypothetical protein